MVGKLTSDGRTVMRDYIGTSIRAFRRMEAELLGEADNPMSRQALRVALSALTEYVVPRRTMFCGSYGYTPMNESLTLWQTTDGGELKTSLLGILLEYIEGGRDIVDCLRHGDVGCIVQQYTRDTVRNQETFESL